MPFARETDNHELVAPGNGWMARHLVASLASTTVLWERGLEACWSLWHETRGGESGQEDLSHSSPSRVSRVDPLLYLSSMARDQDIIE